MKITRSSSFDHVYINNFSYIVGDIDIFTSGRLFTIMTKRGYILGKDIPAEDIEIGFGGENLQLFLLSSCPGDDKQYRLLYNYCNFKINNFEEVQFLVRATQIFVNGDFSHVDFNRFEYIKLFSVFDSNKINIGSLIDLLHSNCYDIFLSDRKDSQLTASNDNGKVEISFKNYGGIFRVKEDDSSTIVTIKTSDTIEVIYLMCKGVYLT